MVQPPMNASQIYLRINILQYWKKMWETLSQQPGHNWWQEKNLVRSLCPSRKDDLRALAGRLEHPCDVHCCPEAAPGAVRLLQRWRADGLERQITLVLSPSKGKGILGLRRRICLDPTQLTHWNTKVEKWDKLLN